MKIKCVAIDDEPWALSLITGYVNRIPDMQLSATFEDAIAGSEFLREYPVDLLFLDINMPDMDGLSLASSLTKKPFIIFTTAYRKFAYEGFELDAIDYLLKPFSFDRFKKAIDKVKKSIRAAQTITDTTAESIYVWSEYQQVRVLLPDIEYIEAREDYTCFYLKGKPPLLTLLTLKKTLELLPADQFIRIHRSYIIPLAAVEKIAGRKIKLITGQELPIGKSYAEILPLLNKRL